MAEYAVARLDDLLNWGRKVKLHLHLLFNKFLSLILIRVLFGR